MMRRIILILFIISPYIECNGGGGDENKKNEKECLADYLKRNQILDSSFPSAPYGNSTETCDQIVIKLVSDFNNDINRRIEIENYKEHQTCIMENVENYEIVKFFLKGLVHSWHGKIENFKRKSSNSKNKVIAVFDKICDPDVYGKEFDLIRGSSSSPTDETIPCIQKAYFEENILNAADYNIDITKIAAENCNDSTPQSSIFVPPFIEKSYFGLPARKVKKCYTNYFLKNKVSLRMATSVVFKNVHITENQIANIRKKYSQWMMENQNSIFNCMNKNI